MNCESESELLPELLAGTLDRETETELLSHLARCADCRGELAFWAKIAEAAKAESAAMPESLREDVRESLFGERAKTLAESLRLVGRSLSLARSACRLALRAAHL